MNRLAGASGLCLAAIVFFLQPAQAASPVSEPNQIDILYVEPQSEELRPAYVALQKRAVLEQVKTFLSPVQLPRRLLVKAEQCGARTRDYQPGGPVTICYEYVQQVEQALPDNYAILIGPGGIDAKNKVGLRKETLLIAPVVMQSFARTACASITSSRGARTCKQSMSG